MTELVAACAIALSAIGMAISMAALVFVGGLDDGLARATGSFVVAGAIVIAYLGWRSSIVPVVGVIQDGPAIVMVAVAANVAARGNNNAAIDVFVMIGLASVLTGVAMWLIGRFGLGNMVRYVPTTVVGAFVAGTGWLLVKGGVDVMLDFGVGLDDLDIVFRSGMIERWLPGLVIGIGIWLVGRSDRVPPLATSLAVVGTVAAFYMVVALVSSVDAVRDGGWLVGPFADGSGAQLITPTEFADVRWGDLISDLPGIASVVGVGVIALLLNLTGLDFLRREDIDIDIDAELRHAGIANVVTSPLGALPGFHGLGDTVLAERLGGRRRLVPIGAGVIVALFGLVGVAAVGYVPRLAIGSLLVIVGIELLHGWVVELVRSVSLIERLLSIGIVLVISFLGILEGIAVGMIAACAIFIVRYSRIDPIGRTTNGQLQSRVDRTPAELDALGLVADRVVVFEVQGYLFFGSISAVDRQVRDVCAQAADTLDAVIVDFRHVTGIDTSGYALFGQVIRRARERCAAVVVSGMDETLRAVLVVSEPEALASVHWVDTLDDALELTETRLLDQLGLDDPAPGGAGLSVALTAAFREVSFPAGSIVLTQGSPSDEMFVVRHGDLTAYRIDEAGERHRLRQFGAGALIGEIGLITGAARSAEIVTETDVEAYVMTRDEYAELARHSPGLSFELHEHIMVGQAARILSLSSSLAALLG